jgi:hypothetical protein
MVLPAQGLRATSMTLSNPQEVADVGERIYRERYKEAYERNSPGQFVAINVENGKAYLGVQPEEALERARSESPKGVFHLIRVGSPGAFRVSHVNSATTAVDGLFRPRG